MPRLTAVVGLLLVKEQIRRHYAQVAQLDRQLTDFKRKHGYCGGRPFCMTVTGPEVHSCKACLKANANPKYAKQISEYGRMRRKEREEERRKKPAKKPRRKAA